MLDSTTRQNPNASADHLLAMEKRIAAQQLILDRAAGILVEAIELSDGINVSQAEACIHSIRGQLAEVGKTTAEERLENLCARVGAAAGIAPHIEFNPLAVLDHMRVVLHAQQRNADRLSWAVSVLWKPADTGRNPAMVVRTKGTRAILRTFPPGATWLDALDDIIQDRPARAEPAAPAPTDMQR
ncbi:hypothetical protein LXA47_25015 [Massilia sp. P8910]|uniref:hypothetical protein n=1 Tax=Massilia antarctica TaxID=2765360 RepID=UPI001E33C670|nr:hypothetical protein [Massilia antarctica]MCE3606839.1 hypothetical protein [Massilia antarctica]